MSLEQVAGIVHPEGDASNPHVVTDCLSTVFTINFASRDALTVEGRSGQAMPRTPIWHPALRRQKIKHGHCEIDCMNTV